MWKCSKISAAVMLFSMAAGQDLGSTMPTAPPALPSGLQESGRELTKADADAWLDGFMPYALERNDIAGAVVVIVKDGQVLTQRGFGYADVAARKRVDPATTMFRPGSISKLFTWTAVMQLVEQGKIDLDVDINRYLDFQIPSYGGKPITMRNLLTHRSGFEEVEKDGIRFDGDVPPLGDVLKRWIPKRVFAPGTIPAYSNYGAALAGYIVQRESGIAFEEYIERNIFQRLGMAHSTFRQPLPPQFVPFMAKGYPIASGPPKPYELISVPPAGSAVVSAPDMAKFMIAHLDQGEALLQPQTARLMHDPTYVSVPGTDRMALGFYEQRVNGQSAIAHGGDLNYFHSYMWILPKQNVGMFFSMNSAGEDDANFGLRLALFQQFGDRYFPAKRDAPPAELRTAKAHARMLVGRYISSRGSFSNFLDMANLLGQVNIGLDENGRPLIPALPGFGEAPRQWIEIAPFVWKDAYGHQSLGATVENGRVVRWSVDEVSPFMVWTRAPWYRDSAWLLPLLVASVSVVIVTALSWPLGAISRRRYGAMLTIKDGDLRAYRLVRGFSWLILAVLGGWWLLLMAMEHSEGHLDGLIWLLEITGAIGFFGLLATALWNLGIAAARRLGWLTGFWRVLLVLAAASIVWATVDFHLVSFGADF